MSIWDGGGKGTSGAVSSVNGKTGDIVVTKSDLGLTNVSNTSDADKPVSTAQAAAIAAEHTDMVAQVATCIQASKIGAASGVASLDATGKLTTAQIPESILSSLKWQGVWNAGTNTPTLSTTVETAGHFYKVSVGGTTSAPTGSSVTYNAGDWLIAGGSPTTWQVVPNTLNDATTTTKGVVQLAGDLAGGAAAPLVAKINGVTVPASAPTAARKMLMSSSTSALQYDGITAADLPDATTAAKGIVQLAGDLGGTATAPLAKKVNGWTVGNEPSLVNQVLAVTDVANKTLGYVSQSGGGGVSANYLRASRTATQTIATASVAIIPTNVDVQQGSAISINTTTGAITLKAGYTFYLRGSAGYNNSANYVDFQFYNYTASAYIGCATQVAGNSFSGIATAVISTTVDTVVYLYATQVSGSTTLGLSGTWNSFPYVDVEVVSGSAAVTGQSVDYAYAKSTTSQSYSLGSYLTFDSSIGSIVFNGTTTFTLNPGVTYELSCSARQSASSSAMDYTWYNITTSANIGSQGAAASNTTNADISAECVITPTVNTQVAVKMVAGAGTIGSRFITIKQLGTSSVIDMVGATSTADGVKGTVPAPATGDQNDFLKGDGTWASSLPIYSSTVNYAAGDRTIFNNIPYVANGAIAAGTGRSLGTSGATWSPILPAGYTWRGIYANSTSYTLQDVFATTAGSYMTYVVTSAFTSSTSGPSADIATPGGVGVSCVSPMPAGNVTTYNNSNVTYFGATSSAAGRAGVVPAPALGYQGAYLRGDGTWDKASWTSYTPTITGSTTNPTLATTKTLIARYRQVGKSLQIAVTYYAASSTGAANGSGAYLFSLPSGFTIDTTVAPIVSTPTSVVGDFCGMTASTLGIGVAGINTSASSCIVVGSSATTVSLMATQTTNTTAMNTLVGSSSFPIVSPNSYYKFTADIPIV